MPTLALPTPTLVGSTLRAAGDAYLRFTGDPVHSRHLLPGLLSEGDNPRVGV